MEMALEKIAFLPFGYLIDKYRWGVYDNSITTEELNAGWWNLRESLQGVTTPEDVRGEEFFDPGAKYHVPANVPYIRYFVSFIVQFQFHERLCAAAGHTGPLHTCDIYGNQEAGTILREALKKGFSEPWPVVLKELGGSENIDPQAIIKYFDPLIKFLDVALAEADQCIGWGEDCIKIIDDLEKTTLSPENNTMESSMSTEEPTTESPSLNETQALEDMDAMDAELTVLVQNATLYDWEYYTNESDATAADAVGTCERAVLHNAAWALVSHVFRDWYNKTIAFYEYEEFESEDLKRRFRLQKNLGTSALSDKDLDRYSAIVKNMTSIYNEGRVVDMNNDTVSYGIDELEIKMAETKDAKELEHYWTEWRSHSGKLMIDDFEEYITLLNTAAQANGFHEAIGDTIALSVSTPSHLKMIENYLTSNANNATGDFDMISHGSFFETELDYGNGTNGNETNGNSTSEYKQNINFLMKTALAKIAFLPYAYILDQWRWELFEDNNKHDDYNRKWWELRLDVQGICPPGLRHPNEDFDAGSKYHVADSVPYIRYFVAHILQFQFHHRLCEIAFGDQFEETEVFNCDIYNSIDAGTELKKLLNRGASVEWHEQLKDFMGGSNGSMNAIAILNYFSPLQDYLDEFIKNNSIEVGWKEGQVDHYMIDSAYIPATVPIVVGVVLAVMVLIVIIAYFVGQARQKKKAKKNAASSTPENIEISVQNTETKSTGSVDSN
ncbi:Angiotensin-converting enzyme [Portunus trituberculatus]|uniref:Angiotensin-converting enzyme n=1 Tax=Portunus trituberculatus TaxID=210409 RepID=A0A5B7EZS5_PORTR|nr:Angiotensin-converting enzyme [Portunus trituberculatus]